MNNINDIYKKMNIKIGLLGGTFDPPHLGHMHMAQCAMSSMDLDYIIFLICGNTPHKDVSAVSDPAQRLAMLKLAINGSSNYFIDESELYSDKLSYTVNSILRINAILHKSSELHFIIGADSLMNLDRWYEAATLFQNTKFICIPREGFNDKECMDEIGNLSDRYSADIKYIKCPRLDAASADIRQMLMQGMDISGFIDSEVEEYIKLNGLYKL